MAKHKCPDCGAVHERSTMSKKKPKIIPRSRWTTSGSNAPAARGDSIIGVALHHPGTAGTLGTESEADTAARLEGYRRNHVNGHGWTDIAYNVAVDQRGNVWTLRGVSRQSGANGTSAANRAHGAILMLVGNDEEPSAAMIDAVHYAVRLWDVRYDGVTAVRPHSYFVRTACPGKAARRLLNDGETFYVKTARERWPDVK